jgi:hypothetical protein
MRQLKSEDGFPYYASCSMAEALENIAQEVGVSFHEAAGAADGAAMMDDDDYAAAVDDEMGQGVSKKRKFDRSKPGLFNYGYSVTNKKGEKITGIDETVQKKTVAPVEMPCKYCPRLFQSSAARISHERSHESKSSYLTAAVPEPEDFFCEQTEETVAKAKLAGQRLQCAVVLERMLLLLDLAVGTDLFEVTVEKQGGPRRDHSQLNLELAESAVQPGVVTVAGFIGFDAAGGLGAEICPAQVAGVGVGDHLITVGGHFVVGLSYARDCLFDQPPGALTLGLQRPVVKEVDSAAGRSALKHVDRRSMNHSGGKATRKSFTVAKKSEVIQHFADLKDVNPAMPDSDARRATEAAYDMSYQQINRWLLDKDEITKAAGKGRAKELKRLGGHIGKKTPKQRGRFPEAERKTHDDFKKKRQMKRKVTDVWLRMTMKGHVLRLYGPTSDKSEKVKAAAAAFKASKNWRCRWSRRWHVVKRRRTNKKVTPLEQRLLRWQSYHRRIRRFMATDRPSDATLADSRRFMSVALCRPFGIVAVAAFGATCTGFKVHSLVSGGAAEVEGSLASGDELRMVEDTPVAGKSFSDTLEVITIEMGKHGSSPIALVFQRPPLAPLPPGGDGGGGAAGADAPLPPGGDGGGGAAGGDAPPPPGGDGGGGDGGGSPAGDVPVDLELAVVLLEKAGGGEGPAAAAAAAEDAPAADGGDSPGEGGEDPGAETDDDIGEYEGENEEQGADEDARKKDDGDDDDDHDHDHDHDHDDEPPLPSLEQALGEGEATPGAAPSSRALVGKNIALFEEDCGWYSGIVVRKKHGSGADMYVLRVDNEANPVVLEPGLYFDMESSGNPADAASGSWVVIST